MLGDLGHPGRQMPPGGWLGPTCSDCSHPLSPGTMLDQDGINDEDVSSPDNLQK